MKLKTWEKWYWGIDLTLMTLYFIGYHKNEDPNNYIVTINGNTRPITPTEVLTTGLIIFVGVAGLLWLIIRYFTNKDKKK